MDALLKSLSGDDQKLVRQLFKENEFLQQQVEVLQAQSNSVSALLESANTRLSVASSYSTTAGNQAWLPLPRSAARIHPFNSLSRLTYRMTAKGQRVVEELADTLEKTDAILGSGINKISAKASPSKFDAALPFSPDYPTGITALAYGVIERASDMVDDLSAQVHQARSSRDQQAAHLSKSLSQIEELEGLVHDLKEKQLVDSNSPTEDAEFEAALVCIKDWMVRARSRSTKVEQEKDRLIHAIEEEKQNNEKLTCLVAQKNQQKDQLMCEIDNIVRQNKELQIELVRLKEEHNEHLVRLKDRLKKVQRLKEEQNEQLMCEVEGKKEENKEFQIKIENLVRLKEEQKKQLMCKVEDKKEENKRLTHENHLLEYKVARRETTLASLQTKLKKVLQVAKDLDEKNRLREGKEAAAIAARLSAEKMKAEETATRSQLEDILDELNLEDLE